MNNHSKNRPPRRKQARKTITRHSQLDGPFAALAALRDKMAGHETRVDHRNHDADSEQPSSRFVSTPTGGTPRKSNKNRFLDKVGREDPTLFRVKRSTLKPLDKSSFDNGLQPAETTSQNRSWKGCADEVEEWLDEVAGTARASDHEYPEQITAEVESNIKDRLQIGTVASMPEDEETIVILGIDFGTTSTKIVASFPYKPGEPTYALPALEGLCAEEHPHLFPSAIWVDAHGDFHLSPGPGRSVLPELKRDLLEARASCTGAGPDILIAPETAVTAFLALHVRHARGWILRESNACRRDERCGWTVHVGFPAAALDKRLSMPFERTLAAALILAREPGTISRHSVENVLHAITDASSILEWEGGAVFPEISAAVAGFAASRRLEAGLYCLMDIGGMTLDCCTFDLRPSEDGVKNPIFVACIAPFGIQNLDLWRKSGRQVETFVDAIKWPLRDAIWTTKARRQPNSLRWSSYLPIFATGGGATAQAYRAALDATGPWLRKNLSASKGVRILNLPVPETLQNPLCDDDTAHRLNVAIGLSQEASSIPVSTLPGQIEDVCRPHRRRAIFVGAEQV